MNKWCLTLDHISHRPIASKFHGERWGQAVIPFLVPLDILSICSVSVATSEQGNKDEQVSCCPQGAAWRVGWSKSAPVCPALQQNGCTWCCESTRRKWLTALGHRERVREAGTSGLGLQDTPFPSRSLTLSLGTTSAFKGKTRVGPHDRLPRFSFPDTFMGRRGRHRL